MDNSEQNKFEPNLWTIFGNDDPHGAIDVSTIPNAVLDPKSNISDKTEMPNIETDNEPVTGTVSNGLNSEPAMLGVSASNNSSAHPLVTDMENFPVGVLKSGEQKHLDEPSTCAESAGMLVDDVPEQEVLPNEQVVNNSPISLPTGNVASAQVMLVKTAEEKDHEFSDLDEDDELLNDPITGQVMPTFLNYLAKELIKLNVEILYGGMMERPRDRFIPDTPDKVDKALSHVRTSYEGIVDLLQIRSANAGIDIKPAEIKLGVRHLVKKGQANRIAMVLKPLYDELTPEEHEKATAQWKRLGDACFDSDPTITMHVLMHFIYQVKLKSIGGTVDRPLMAVIFNAIQGCGKTHFTTCFLSPLMELCPAPVALSDLVDIRSADIFSFPALLVDDMEQLRGRVVALLKAILTNRALSRRKLFSSALLQSRQCATLIGTSNHPVEQLIPDDTGHRRFVTLHFRNGEIKKGGDPEVWKAVSETDFALLWRSVDVFASAPINTVLTELTALQEANSLDRLVRDWLFNLNFLAEDVRDLIDDRKISATALFELFGEQTDHEVAIQAFSRSMRKIVHDHLSPVSPPRRNKKHVYYPIKKFALEETLFAPDQQ